MFTEWQVVSTRNINNNEQAFPNNTQNNEPTYGNSNINDSKQAFPNNMTAVFHNKQQISVFRTVFHAPFYKNVVVTK